MKDRESQVKAMKESIEDELDKYKELFDAGSTSNKLLFVLHSIIQEQRLDAFRDGYVDGFLDGRQ